MSDLHKRLLKDNPAFKNLPPRMPGLSSGGGGGARRCERAKRDYTVTPWTEYYDRMEDVRLDNGNVFRVYVKGDSGPVFFFLHGGGFSALSWAILSSILVKKVRCQCYSIDIRGHG